MTEPYRQARQAATREPTAWENAFGDVLEAAFSDGAYELEAVTAHINASHVRPPDGQPWTPERVTAVLHELSAD